MKNRRWKIDLVPIDVFLLDSVGELTGPWLELRIDSDERIDSLRLLTGLDGGDGLSAPEGGGGISIRGSGGRSNKE